MDTSSASFRPSYFTQLVNHLHGFAIGQREQMARTYGAPSAEASELAQFWVRHPDTVLEVVRDELDSSVGWRIVEEAAIDHDLPVLLDWATGRGRQQVSRLGLLEPKTDEHGHTIAVMPGALAAIFAPRIRGQRGSLPVLLGRRSEDELQKLADYWGLATDGSKLEIILRLCDHFVRDEMIDDILAKLPDPDWVGDALMVVELGGMCHWEGIYGYDFDDNSDGGDNVVPLMRRSERKQQRDLAETLLEMGVLFRIENEAEDVSMVAVAEALWPGLWRLGRRWLMDWVVQTTVALEDAASGSTQEKLFGGLRAVLKWWSCEAERSNLAVGMEAHEPLTAETRQRLDDVYRGDRAFDWDAVWNLGRQMRLLEVRPEGTIGRGREAEALLDCGEAKFIREALLEWCLGYTGGAVDENLPEAIGLDEQWRNRATGLMRRENEPVPAWMEHSGVEPETTGGGWLRPSGTGSEEMISFEYGLTVGFVSLVKVLWLDLLSLLEPRRYPTDLLAVLLQNVAGVAMFTQLRMVLEEQPAPVYLPFQRASFLMDQRQHGPVSNWVDDIVIGLLEPLGVASADESGETVRLVTESLRVETPPGWPEGQRAELIDEMYGGDVDFEVPTEAESALREVSTVPEHAEAAASVDEPLSRLVELAADCEIVGFDGRFIRFEGGE